MRSIIIGFLLSLIFAAPAVAQTQAQAIKLKMFLDQNTKELGDTTQNIYQMALGMQSPEIAEASFLADTLSSHSNYFDTVSIIASIYAMMIDSRDKEVVRKVLVIYVKTALRASDMVVGIVNKQLVKLHSPAAIADAQKARDLIQKIRDEIQRIVPGS